MCLRRCLYIFTVVDWKPGTAIAIFSTICRRSLESRSLPWSTGCILRHMTRILWTIVPPVSRLNQKNCRKKMPYLDVEHKLFVGGSSAGGYLSMMLCFAPQYLEKYGMKPTDVAGYIHDAGQPTVHFNILRERGQDTRLVRIDESAPIWYIDHTPKPEEVPAMCILYSENDITNRPEQTALLYRTMAHFAYPMEKIEMHYFPGYGHCGQLLAVDPDDGIHVFCKTAAAFIQKTYRN